MGATLNIIFIILEPDNILLGGNMLPGIADFGVSVLLAS
jgi:hypothetical protein